MSIEAKIVPFRPAGPGRRHVAGFEAARREVDSLPEDQRAEWLIEFLKEIMLDANANVGIWPDGPSLTVQQRVVFCALYGNEGRTVRNDQMEAAMYPDAVSMPEDPRNVLKVQIAKIRRKIKGTGLFIDTVWGEGYRLERARGLVLPWEASQ